MVNLPCRMGKAEGCWKRTIFVAAVAGERKQCNANAGCWGDRWGRLRLRKKAANFQKDLCLFLIFFFNLIAAFFRMISKDPLFDHLPQRLFKKKNFLCFSELLSLLCFLSLSQLFFSLSLSIAPHSFSLFPLFASLSSPPPATP